MLARRAAVRPALWPLPRSPLRLAYKGQAQRELQRATAQG